MFLRNVKNLILKPYSMTATLTLLYCLSTVFLLAFVYLSSSVEIKEILEEKNYQFVSQKINILSEILLQPGKNDYKLKHEVEEIPSLLSLNSIYKYYIRLKNISKNEEIKTDNMDVVFKNTSFFNKHNDKSMEESINWKSPDGKNYFLMQRKIRLNNTNWIIQVGLDTSYEKDRLLEYKNKLIIIFIIGILLAFFLGFLITKRGMKKLHDLTNAAQAVTSSSLHKRINANDWPYELRKLGMAFNQMLDRLEESFLRLKQFSSDLAHELRTPVNNLLGEIEIAISNPPQSQDEYQDILASNIEEVRRISSMIENLLFLAKTENPKLDLEKVKLNLRHEINLVKEYYQSMADDFNINIIFSGEGELYGNSIMIRRMISNLLSNSIKYSPPFKNIYINLFQDQNNVVKILIRDEGLGIPEEHLSKIFSRFYRVDGSRTQQSGGFGLGLPIVKSIVELHHGTISIMSKPNQGTLVEIIFAQASK
jgi:two-component system heavy metal sensor histidine kinase CusS